MEAYGVGAHHTIDLHPTQQKYPMHSHETHEILLLLSDFCSFQVSDWTYQMERGDIIMIPGGMSHRLLWEKDEHCDDPLEFYYAQFDSNILPQEVVITTYINKLCHNSDIEGGFVWRLDASSLAYVEANLLRLSSINDTPVLELYLTYLRPILREVNLCTDAVQGKSGGTRKRSRNGEILFDRVSLYIHEHYADIQNNSFVPEVFHYSAVYVNSLFKRYVSISLWQYVIDVRLERVHDRLLEGVPVEKAAHDCGFDDYSNFYRMFRKKYGISPTKCKKSKNNKDTDN